MSRDLKVSRVVCGCLWGGFVAIQVGFEWFWGINKGFKAPGGRSWAPGGIWEEDVDI